jgi:hypothetical protein
VPTRLSLGSRVPSLPPEILNKARWTDQNGRCRARSRFMGTADDTLAVMELGVYVGEEFGS